jgi:hypothetical protein
VSHGHHLKRFEMERRETLKNSRKSGEFAHLAGVQDFRLEATEKEPQRLPLELQSGSRGIRIRWKNPRKEDPLTYDEIAKTQ